MKSIAAVLKFLTIWGRFTRHPPTPELIGAGAVYFPLVGLTFGLVLALLNRALGLYLESEVLSITLVMTLIIGTGAIHLEGMKNTFDATPQRSLRPTIAAQRIFGLLATLFTVLFKIRAIDIMEDKLTLGLLLTPAFARWALVIFLYGAHQRCEESTRLIAANIKLWHLLVTTAAMLALALYLSGRSGLWVALSVSVIALLARSLLSRWHGVLTHDNLGAVVEISEVLSLILVASL
jgi:adenosylcobinamide-GDP ribazoletransferase